MSDGAQTEAMKERDEYDLSDEELLSIWEQGEPVEIVDTIIGSDLPWLQEVDSAPAAWRPTSRTLRLTIPEAAGGPSLRDDPPTAPEAG